jgi:MiaB-like tRNA modifying enzyme
MRFSKNVYVSVLRFKPIIHLWDLLMRIYVKGFGCPSSIADAETLEGCLLQSGYELSNTPQTADLILYNTCAVKTPTENRMISLLKEVPREKKLIVSGCLPIVNFERIEKEVEFDGIVGPAFGEKIVDVVKQVSEGIKVERLENSANTMPRLSIPQKRSNPVISKVITAYGCLGACAYCCVRFARGNLRSHSKKQIEEKAKKDVSNGVRELWLTSQDMASYGRDIGTRLPSLIQTICSIKGDFFVRVGMMTPNTALDILDELLLAFNNSKVFKFLHLPLQSGDDEVLGLMNRSYSTNDFVSIVKRFRSEFTQLTLATDVIVGFPGETDEAFNHTKELIGELKPDIVNISKFFPRPKTAALKTNPKVPPDEVKRRSTLLAKATKKISFERNMRWTGWTGTILLDEIVKSGTVVGRNSSYKAVVVSDRSHAQLDLGQFLSVRILDASQSCLIGEII